LRLPTGASAGVSDTVIADFAASDADGVRHPARTLRLPTGASAGVSDTVIAVIE